MKVAIEQKTLLALIYACGEAQGVLLRGSEFGKDSSQYRSFSNACANARTGLQQAVELLDTEPLAPAPQQDFHSGPG